MEKPPKCPWRDNEEIRARADQMRGRYSPLGALPVDVDLIAEKMGVRIVPQANLRAEADTEACLSIDRQDIYVDDGYVRDPQRYEFRTRFSIAHELGHFELHEDLYLHFQARADKGILGWSHAVREYLLAESTRYEFQAHEFAGRLLVPVEDLKKSVGDALQKIDEAGVGAPNDDDEGRHLIANFIHRRFEVSARVIAIRLRKEDIKIR